MWGHLTVFGGRTGGVTCTLPTMYLESVSITQLQDPGTAGGMVKDEEWGVLRAGAGGGGLGSGKGWSSLLGVGRGCCVHILALLARMFNFTL